MKVSILRGFVPLDDTIFEYGGGERIKLAGSVDRVSGCSQHVSLNFHGETLSASITPVSAGDKVILKRGDENKDVAETFDKSGVLITLPVPARAERLRPFRGREIPLAVKFEGMAGVDRDTRHGPVFLATSSRVASLSLTTIDDADCMLTLID